MKENFISDSPLSEEIDDKFQRYPFSKRIAEAIINRTSIDNIVIGIYGTWGEGKTTVLNFIEKELKSEDKIITIKFNPWRYIDEISLLKQFFLELATALDANIKSQKEKAGEILKKYSKLLSIDVPLIGNVGDKIESAGNLLSDVCIDTLKERIDKILKENKKKVVIFIDDLDRLEKEEIHAIFRLVKLTGDFAYTTYILSFDEKIVSSAIGVRFGSGDQKAGMNFLEKIIQIPIKIPLAQKTALKKYCNNIIIQALKSNQINLTINELEEFEIKFSSNYINRLTTPRLAVRYGNLLSFSLPLLIGEINYIDLLLIEAVHAFYPEFYDFIRYYPSYFIEEFGKNITNNPKIDKFKILFNEYTKQYSPDDIDNVKGALRDLFPLLAGLWGSSYSWSKGTPESHTIEKRISSIQYFNRYFSYTVIEGDISDVAFDYLINNIKDGDISNKIESTKELIQSALPENFISKIRAKEKIFDSETSIRLSLIFSQLCDYFPDKENDPQTIWAPFYQAAIFVAHLIKNQVEENKRYNLIENIIQNSSQFKFAFLISTNFLNDDEVPIKTFTKVQCKKLFRKLIERAIDYSNSKPMWEIFNNQSYFLLGNWGKYSSKHDLNLYIRKHLDIEPKTVISLIKVFVHMVPNYSNSISYYDDLHEENYKLLSNIIDTDLIYTKIKKILKISLTTKIKYIHLGDKQTNKNMMLQFVYWYINNKTK